MNTYITLACLLAVLGLSQGSAIGAYGYGVPWVAPAAVSTANLIKAAPIPVIRHHVAPVIAPVVTAPVLRTVAVGNLGYGLGGYGLGGYGLGYGLGWGGHGAWGGWGGNGAWGGHGGWGGWNGLGGWGGWGWGKH